MWDAATGTEARAFPFDQTGHAGFVTDIAALPDGRGIVTGGRDGRIVRWDADTGDVLGEYHGHRGIVWRVVPLSAGDRFVSVGEDRTLRLWDVASGSELRRLAWQGDVTRYRGLDVSADGRLAASAGDDGVVRLWDLAGAGNLPALPDPGPATGQPDAIGPRGARAAGTAVAGAQPGRLDAGTADAWTLAPGLEDRIVDIAVRAAQPATGTLAVDDWVQAGRLDPVLRVLRADGTVVGENDDEPGSDTRNARLDNVALGAGEAHRLDVFAFDPRMRGAYQLVVTSTLAVREVRRLGAFDAPARSVATGSPTPARARRFWGLALSPDGATVAVGEGIPPFAEGQPFRVTLWDLATGLERRVLSEGLAGHLDTIRAVAFSPDGATVLSASFDALAILWDARTGHVRGRLSGHDNQLIDAAFSADGRQVLTTSGDDAVILWDVASGEPLHRLTAHAGDVQEAAFAPDSRTAWSAGSDGKLVEWDLSSGAERRRFDHGPAALGVAVSPNGRLLASCGEKGSLALWDLAAGLEVRRVTGHAGEAVESIAFSPDGRHVVTAAGDRTVRVWRTDTLTEAARIVGHTRAVVEAVFTPDGTRVVSSSHDGTVRVWDVAGLPGR